MFSIKKILASLFLVLLAACQDKNSVPKTDEELIKSGEAQDLTLQVPSNEFTVLKDNLSWEEEKEIYDRGCKTKGEPQSIIKTDAYLYVGDIFESVYGFSRIMDKMGFGRFTSDLTIAEKDDFRVKTNSTYKEIIGPRGRLNLSEIFYKTPHIIEESSINEQGEVDYKAEVNIRELPEEMMPAEFNWSCRVDFQNSLDGIYKVALVKYLFDGTDINAHLSHSKYEGMVFCEKHKSDVFPDKPLKSIEMGMGSYESVSVISNEVVPSGFNSCGGTYVYSSYIIRLDTGRVLDSYASKLIKAPVRF
jgi:hypothetical protein